MATEEEFKKASQLTALTYMVAGCLNYSIENLNKYLDAKNLHISGSEKMLFNRIKSQISQLQSNLYTLEGMAFKVMAKDEEGKLAYQTAFAQVTKAISKGKFSKEDFKDLLEVYEDRTEKTEG